MFFLKYYHLCFCESTIIPNSKTVKFRFLKFYLYIFVVHTDYILHGKLVRKTSSFLFHSPPSLSSSLPLSLDLKFTSEKGLSSYLFTVIFYLYSYYPLICCYVSFILIYSYSHIPIISLYFRFLRIRETM